MPAASRGRARQRRVARPARPGAWPAQPRRGGRGGAALAASALAAAVAPPWRAARAPGGAALRARAGGQDGGVARGPLSKHTVARLRERLRERGLPVSGRKAELVERLRGRGHRVTAGPLSPGGRRAVREAQSNGDWQMSLLDWYVRPPPVLPRGIRNPLCDLGECGDLNCALYRLKEGSESVRSEILEFCVGQILRHMAADRHAGIVYCSLGCGCLYFDWELLDRLIHAEGFQVAQVWLVERCYRPSNNESGPALRAREAFARWFAGSGMEIHAFASAGALQRWVQAFPGAGRANVVMQCDAVDTAPLLDEDSDFRSAVADEGALNLQAYSQLLARRRPGPGRRRDPVGSVPVRRARRHDAGVPKGFRLLEEETRREGRWVRPHEAASEDLFEDVQQGLIEDVQREYR